MRRASGPVLMLRAALCTLCEMDMSGMLHCLSGGRNGYGAKLCNVFSTKFVVETQCAEFGKSFRQVRLVSCRISFL